MSKVTSIPQLRFPEFSGEWKEKKLSDVAEIVGGGTPPTAVEKYWGGDIQWFTPTEIKNKYIVNSKRTITQVGLDTSSARLLPKGTLLFSSRATVGEIGIAVQECTTNQGFQSFIVNKDNDSEFLYNWIIKNKKEFIRRASGSTFLEIGKSEIKKIKSNIPLLSEQQKIAAFLTAVDNKIEQLSKKQALLGEYKKGLMQQIFSQAIRFKADDGSDFPDWKENKVDEFMEVTRGQVLAVPEMRQVESEIFKYPVYSSQTKNNGLTGYYTDYLFEDCITWTTDGANAGDVNYRAGKFYCTNVCGVLRSKKGYANLCIAQILNSVSRRYVSYVGNPKLMNNVMEKIKISIPSSINEQTKIANFLSSVDSKIEEVGKQLDESKQFKKALLQKMFV